ncbi:IclR family transcriptional regulator C-terminal domain-containing protein [Glycomyces sp. TRM65418]|uniref:IclR family transcriptional regulator C-terminal domain-containing protein n=1 Tax=Glycomyces sp. TRM65418 TaxID=2867006 RepID=UPI001CE4D1E8|nr:IclR family transcriptional regulator C-terminal domain-containing protein [Glycomyces sp. TRM65418]MCC3762616.1 IclR family transcriptional regulator C-terminal domain-containing protein [Glycomyces sp. TRM65418]QZD56654.1 IclR family transcriptional regulator C-terminal domain-containing protein [Glycomyces sp. TRM65418]
MDELDHPRTRGHRVQSSERTFRILDAVIAHPGRTVKQLVRLMGDAVPEHTLRDHLRVLITSHWVHRSPGGRLVPGPKAGSGGVEAIRLFQQLTRILPPARPGLGIEDIVAVLDAAPHAVQAALDVGIEFGCIAEETGTFRLRPDGLLLPPCTASDEDIGAVLKEFTAESGHDAALVHLSQEQGLILSHLHRAPGQESLLEDIGADAAHATASGQAVLTWLDQDQRERYLARHGMPRFTSLTPTSADELEPLLVREPGRLFVAEGQYCTVGSCLALLVHTGPRTNDRIALTTSVWRRNLESESVRLTTHLYRAAARLIPILDGPLIEFEVRHGPPQD